MSLYNPLVKDCEIRSVGDGWGSECHVMVILEGEEDKGWQFLFRFFPDEHLFAPSDFKGKTRTEALQFYTDKDVAYLRNK